MGTAIRGGDTSPAASTLCASAAVKGLYPGGGARRATAAVRLSRVSYWLAPLLSGGACCCCRASMAAAALHMARSRAARPWDGIAHGVSCLASHRVHAHARRGRCLCLSGSGHWPSVQYKKQLAVCSSFDSFLSPAKIWIRGSRRAPRTQAWPMKENFGPKKKRCLANVAYAPISLQYNKRQIY